MRITSRVPTQSAVALSLCFRRLNQRPTFTMPRVVPVPNGAVAQFGQCRSPNVPALRTHVCDHLTVREKCRYERFRASSNVVNTQRPCSCLSYHSAPEIGRTGTRQQLRAVCAPIRRSGVPRRDQAALRRAVCHRSTCPLRRRASRLPRQPPWRDRRNRSVAMIGSLVVIHALAAVALWASLVDPKEAR